MNTTLIDDDATFAAPFAGKPVFMGSGLFAPRSPGMTA
jgi:hypothetical protein